MNSPPPSTPTSPPEPQQLAPINSKPCAGGQAEINPDDRTVSS